MLHRNLLLPASGADQASTGADLMRMRQGGLNDDILHALLLALRVQPQGVELGLQAQTTTSQHPGSNIPSTGHRTISAWRSGRRF